MKVYIVQNCDGDVWLFTTMPKQVEMFNHDLRWAIDGGHGIALCLTDYMNSERYIKEDGGVDCIYLADLIGLKRRGWKNGKLQYEGIGTKEPRQVEINIDIKLLNEFGK